MYFHISKPTPARHTVLGSLIPHTSFSRLSEAHSSAGGHHSAHDFRTAPRRVPHTSAVSVDCRIPYTTLASSPPALSCLRSFFLALASLSTCDKPACGLECLSPMDKPACALDCPLWVSTAGGLVKVTRRFKSCQVTIEARVDSSRACKLLYSGIPTRQGGPPQRPD